LRQRLRAGETVVGIWVTLSDPSVIEIAGYAGVDHVIVDMEHTAIGPETIEGMVRAAQAVNIACLVRVPNVDQQLIGRLLDIGVEGIVVPRVQDVAEATQAVSAARYPPLGLRGLKPMSRAARWSTLSAEEHMRAANEQVLLALTLESRSALSAASRFAEMEGVDLLLVGLTDLAVEARIEGSVESVVRPLLEGVIRATRGAGIAAGLQTGHARMPLSSTEVFQLGFQFSNLWPDDATRLLKSIRESVALARHALADNSPRPGA
jgi:4-hydroxy-2-oxoheptanedioate aldolase